MVAATDTTTLIGARDATALLLGFALAARRSELVLLDWADVVSVEEGLAVDLYRPKVTRTQPLGIPYGSHPATCPVRVVAASRAALAEAGAWRGRPGAGADRPPRPHRAPGAPPRPAG